MTATRALLRRMTTSTKDRPTPMTTWQDTTAAAAAWLLIVAVLLALYLHDRPRP